VTATDRSIELINDVDDRDSFPIATVSGLTHTLKLLGAHMNTEEDVLVLLLTSHGSRDSLVVSNGTVPLLQLGPAELRQALDESGIKWRVIIVSACYSGIFVEPLKTDGTFIATASDAGHTSFGCADDRDLTYFGEAFLKDSVPTTTSLEAAFKKAAGLIQHREGAEHLEHSNPQLYIGPTIRQKLNKIRALNKRWGCPDEPWAAVSPNLLWNISNIPAAQISMIGKIVGPAFAPVAACASFGIAASTRKIQGVGTVAQETAPLSAGHWRAHPAPAARALLHEWGRSGLFQAALAGRRYPPYQGLAPGT